MPAERALQRIQQEMAGDPVVNVLLASRPLGAQDEDDVRRMNIGGGLQESFQRIAREAVEGELRLVEYNPGYKLDPDEIAWIGLDEAENVRTAVDRIARFQDLVIFRPNDDGFLDYLAYYGLFARVGPRTVTLFRKTSEKLELGRSHKIAALLSGGQYDTVQESLFLFDRHRKLRPQCLRNRCLKELRLLVDVDALYYPYIRHGHP